MSINHWVRCNFSHVYGVTTRQTLEKVRLGYVGLDWGWKFCGLMCIPHVYLCCQGFAICTTL